MRLKSDTEGCAYQRASARNFATFACLILVGACASGGPSAKPSSATSIGVLPDDDNAQRPLVIVCEPRLRNESIFLDYFLVRVDGQPLADQPDVGRHVKFHDAEAIAAADPLPEDGPPAQQMKVVPMALPPDVRRRSGGYNLMRICVNRRGAADFVQVASPLTSFRFKALDPGGRHTTLPVSSCHTASNDGGGGASNDSARPVTGCSNASVCACSNRRLAGSTSWPWLRKSRT